MVVLQQLDRNRFEVHYDTEDSHLVGDGNSFVGEYAVDDGCNSFDREAVALIAKIK